jgi:hypothetical protein
MRERAKLARVGELSAPLIAGRGCERHVSRCGKRKVADLVDGAPAGGMANRRRVADAEWRGSLRLQRR